jgi:hypothetical protein
MEDGRLVDLDGIVPFPVAREALEAELAEARVVPASVEGDPRSGDRMFALARLRTYRALCGLHWRHIELNPAWNDLCDAAGEVCAAHGKLDHTPPIPPGFDEARYRQGYEGASHSNLASGGLRGSVDMYMDDSDPSNIDRVGHRRASFQDDGESSGGAPMGRGPNGATRPVTRPHRAPATARS